MLLGLCQVHLGNQWRFSRSVTFLKSHQLDTAEIGPISASAQLSRQYSRFGSAPGSGTRSVLRDERKKVQ